MMNTSKETQTYEEGYRDGGNNREADYLIAWDEYVGGPRPKTAEEWAQRFGAAEEKLTDLRVALDAAEAANAPVPVHQLRAILAREEQ